MLAALNIDFPYVTTFISALLAFALGMIWYHPKVMGKTWMEARGKNMSDMKTTSFPFVLTFLLWMLAAVFYSFMVQFHSINTPPGLFCLSSLLWVAFAMPPTVMGALYTGYPFQAVAVDSAYQLAGYYVFAIVQVAMNYNYV